MRWTCRVWPLLHDRLELLVRGKRTSLPRHQTLRAVHDWSFETLSPTGDSDLVLGLSAAGVTLMLELAPVKEIRRRAAQALELMSNTPGVDQEAEIRIRAALGVAMMYHSGPVPETVATRHQIFHIASAAGHSELRTPGLLGIVNGLRLPGPAGARARIWRALPRRRCCAERPGQDAARRAHHGDRHSPHR